MSQGELSGLEPIATGDLAQTPFAHLMLYLHRQAQGGTLCVTDPRGGVSRVLFNNGNPFMAQLPWEAEDTLHGILPLCGLAGGSYAFYSEELVPQPQVVGEVDPYTVIGASIDRHVRDATVESVVEQFLTVRLRIQRGKRLPRLKLPKSDAPLLDLLRAEPINAQNMIAQSPLTPDRTRRVLYAMLITHAVAPFDTKQLEAHKARQAAIASGPPGARSNPPKVRTVRRSKKISFVKATRTRSLTGVPAPRPGSSLRAPMDNSAGMDVDNTIKLAEHMLSKRSHGEALFALERIARHHPERADIYALRAYIMYDRDARNSSEMPETISKLVQQALELDPGEPRAMFLRAIELRNQGLENRAVRCLRQVIEDDPHNIEAKRELHLLRKRAG